MSRVPATLQVKACKCSKGTVPSLKFRLWLENNTQVPCFWDRLRMRTVKEIDLHKMKMYWGKSGSSSGEGGGKTCTGIFCNAKPVTGKGWRGRKPERFGKVQGNLFPSKITWPQHLSLPTENVFVLCSTKWLNSFLLLLVVWIYSSALLQMSRFQCSTAETTLVFSPTLCNFRGTQKRRVKIQGHKWKCN